MLRQSTLVNHLLRKLTAEEFALLAPHLEPVKLEQGVFLEYADAPIEEIYFPEHGLISVVAHRSDSRIVEVGVIGWEGMSGTATILNWETALNDSFVQIPGKAIRLPADKLREAIAQKPSIRETLLHYVGSFLFQMTKTNVANTYGKIEERLARWLLLVQDRVGGRHLDLTHQFLATMLGVRRSGVTLAVQEIEDRGLISAKRGRLTILDRQGLIELANGLYSGP